tara:strand:- start:268 stop:453 length:186 start_codon:yes stop_codon:yes gene_type:complete
MEIVVKELAKKRYSATLFINGDRFASSVEPRPGCAIRTVLNMLQLEHGAPSGDLVIDISDW